MKQPQLTPDMADYIWVPVDKDLAIELILRAGKRANLNAVINSQLHDFLERTADDPDMWSDEYYERRQTDSDNEFWDTYGRPDAGYRWQALFLPNGTEIKMRYQGQDHYASVRLQKIVYEGQDYSPSELARHIANNTSRNAWRDLWIKVPGANNWQLADTLRRQQL
jgi:hypothetical protein